MSETRTPEFQSSVLLLRDLQPPALNTIAALATYRERMQATRQNDLRDCLEDVICALKRNEELIMRITTIVEVLALSGRGFPVSLRADINDQLDSYNEYFTLPPVMDECMYSFDILRGVYNDLRSYVAAGAGFNTTVGQRDSETTGQGQTGRAGEEARHEREREANRRGTRWRQPGERWMESPAPPAYCN